MLGIMDRHKLECVSAGRNTAKVQKAICSGYFRHAAKKDPQGKVVPLYFILIHATQTDTVHLSTSSKFSSIPLLPCSTGSLTGASITSSFSPAKSTCEKWQLSTRNGSSSSLHAFSKLETRRSSRCKRSSKSSSRCTTSSKNQMHGVFPEHSEDLVVAKIIFFLLIADFRKNSFNHNLFHFHCEIKGNLPVQQNDDAVYLNQAKIALFSQGYQG